jgi:hypothetical protein
MIEDMRIRNLSPHMQRAYVEQVSRFAHQFGQPPERLGQDENQGLADLSGRGEATGGQFDFDRGGRTSVCLYRQPQTAMGC